MPRKSLFRDITLLNISFIEAMHLKEKQQIGKDVIIGTDKDNRLK